MLREEEMQWEQGHSKPRYHMRYHSSLAQPAGSPTDSAGSMHAEYMNLPEAESDQLADFRSGWHCCLPHQPASLPLRTQHALEALGLSFQALANCLAQPCFCSTSASNVQACLPVVSMGALGLLCLLHHPLLHILVLRRLACLCFAIQVRASTARRFVACSHNSDGFISRCLAQVS